MDQLTHPSTELYQSPKRVRVVFGGHIIADSRRAILLRREEAPPVYYFPPDDLQPEILEESGTSAVHTSFGDVKFYTARINGKERIDAAWIMDRPEKGLAGLAGYIAFQWDLMDAWFEEDQEIFVHPRDPRKRIDIAASSAHIKVLLKGETVAESHRPTLLFETGLATRYYLPKLDVRQELLVPSDHVTYCPYKGEARYYSLRLGNSLLEDLVWHYRYTTLDASPIATLLCFYQERITIEVDGRQI